MTDVAAERVQEHWPLVGRRVDLELALATLHAAGSRGLAIHGPTGVGRSRFAAEVIDEAALLNDQERRTIRVVASASAASVPLGALAHLLPVGVIGSGTGAPFDPTRVLAGASDALTSEGPLLLAIDDAHLLDAVSLTLLNQLGEHPNVQLVVTARSDEPEPDGLAALWRTGRIGRIDLAPLSAESADTLLHLGLAGPVDGRTARLLVDAAAGYPLLLREIVRSATDDGSLTRVDGVWRLDGPLPVARRAFELAATRLAQLDGPERDLLDLLALVGETPLDFLESIADTDALERLESLGLVNVRPAQVAGGQLRVAISRHVVTDAARADISPLRARKLLRTHADRFADWAEGSDEDEMRIAGWRLDAGLSGDPTALERAATLARHAEDFESTVRFAEAAFLTEPTLRTGMLRGDALYELCRWQDSEDAFAAAADLPGSPADRLRLIAARSTNLLFGLMRGQDALEMTKSALESLDAGEPQWQGVDPALTTQLRADLVSRVALLQMYGGSPSEAMVTLGDLPAPVRPGDNEDPAVRDALRTRVLWAIPGVSASALTGRTGDAVALGNEAFEEHARLGGEVAFSTLGIHLVTLGLALQEHGDFDQARAVSTTGYEATVADGALLGQIWFGLNLGRIGLITGHPETARRWAREVLAATRSTGWLGPRLMALTGLTAANVLLGDLEAARAAAAEARTIDGDFGFLAPERVLGRAWLAAADGRTDEARAILDTAALDAARTGHVTSESWLRYESARLGSPADQLLRLQELSAASDSALLAARTGYVEAIVSDDPVRLEHAAVALESLGCDLAASELYDAAAEATRAGPRPRGANALALRATEAAGRSEGARSFRLQRLDTIVPLTAREREIAGLAASGVPSKEIAERLYLSVRTVNNHLQNAYTKLGVSSRAEVAALLEQDRIGRTGE